MSAISFTSKRPSSLPGSPVEELSGIDRLEKGSAIWTAHCDGALKVPGQPAHTGLGFADGVRTLAQRALNRYAHHQPAQQPLVQMRRLDLIRRAEDTALILPANGAQLWLQPVSPRKLAVQWNVPSNIRRNCHDLLGGEQADFILRLYQRIPVANGWKSAHRTLEFSVDISRRRCYINLEQSGGVFTSELGVRLDNGRYVFLARSGESALPQSTPAADSRVEFVHRAGSALHLPVCPALFRASPEPAFLLCGDFSERDYRAEAAVCAAYLDFRNEGSRVFRSRGLILPMEIEERHREFRIRQQTLQTAAEAVAHQPRPEPEFALERIDKHPPVGADAALTETVPYQPLQFPPACLATVESRPVRIPAILKPNKAAPRSASRQENRLQPVESRTLEESNRLAGSRRKVVHVKSAGALAEVIKAARQNQQAEIILKGKVKPGRRVRVGGLLIETATDGSFCVACMIRDGKLFVPVEEVTAVTVE